MTTLRNIFDTRNYKFEKIENFVPIKERANGIGILPILAKDNTQSQIDIAHNGQQYVPFVELYVLTEDCGGCASFDYYYPISKKEYELLKKCTEESNDCAALIKRIKERFDRTHQYSFADTTNYAPYKLPKEYMVSEHHTISFTIEGMSFRLAPVYVGTGMAANYPSGVEIYVKNSTNNYWNFVAKVYDFDNPNYKTYWTDYWLHRKRLNKELFDKDNTQEGYVLALSKTVLDLYRLIGREEPLLTMFEPLNKYWDNVDELKDKIQKEIEKWDVSNSFRPKNDITNKAYILLTYIVEHFVRWCNSPEGNTKYLGWDPFTDFIKTRSADNFRGMIRSYKSMDDSFIDEDFDKVVEHLKRHFNSNVMKRIKTKKYIGDSNVIYLNEKLCLTSFMSPGPNCLWIQTPEQRNMPEMEFVGGYPNEYCIFINDKNRGKIKTLDGLPIYTEWLNKTCIIDKKCLYLEAPINYIQKGEPLNTTDSGWSLLSSTDEEYNADADNFMRVKLYPLVVNDRTLYRRLVEYESSGGS